LFETYKKKFFFKNSDNILVTLREDQISAKIFDFVKTVEVNESENFDVKIRDEFYNFGLVCHFFKSLFIIFTSLKCRYKLR
jgi:hypothetical protein